MMATLPRPRAQGKRLGLSSSFSAYSLDLCQLLVSNGMQPLVSETVTLDSLSSGSSDTVPSFPACKSQNLAMIGLGERLKLFSGHLSHAQGDINADLKSPVLITTPTSPRLGTMSKECLNIGKWVESLTCWQAPEHSPWGIIQEKPTMRWIPEGSLYSPEDFSLFLHQARTGQDARVNTSVQSPNKEELMDNGGLFRPSRCDSMDAELVDMMHELRTIKSYFQGNLHDSRDLDACQRSTPNIKHSVPSLVVSNSHRTSPLSLESSRSTSKSNSATLAIRRGRKAPPPLRVKEEVKSQELLYPGIPTAFLGSPSTYTPKFENAYTVANSAAAPVLEIEDMISNLRLQCSSMALHTPPVDTSWNSRSAIGKSAHDSAGKVDGGDEWAFADSILSDLDRQKTLTDHPDKVLTSTRMGTTPKSRQTQLPQATFSKPRARGTPNTAATTSDSRASKSKKVVERVNTLKLPPPAHSTSSSPPVILRSSLAKPPAPRRRTALKSVRFALTHLDFEKNVTSSLPCDVGAFHSSQVNQELPEPHRSRSLRTLKHDTIPESGATSTQVRSAPSTPSARKQTKSWHSPNSHDLFINKPSPADDAKDRTKPVTTGLPKTPRPSVLQTTTDTEGIKVELKPSESFYRSAQSLGRHSLSRIIKGPIFSGRESKRATISSVFTTRWESNENAVRRGSAAPTSASAEKKSRMPIPLRNILTRFK
ncbi:hypothetical protein B0H34DRAFT_407690 [Crassisporium funariophilum]|nr:hypothetical protein B0H34DRAFT_407690 [Crassisporium funariophilum]